MKIGIVGYGIVGKATHESLCKKLPVIIHDTNLNSTISNLKFCQYVFFCIPTDSHDSIKLLISEIEKIKTINPNCIVVIRSTVPVGTCSIIENIIKDKIYYMPEFLRERIWQEDCLHRPIIVGSDKQAVPSWLEGEECFFCSLEEAEIIKMLSNNIAAARVVIANHFYELSKAVGANYDSVLDAYLKVNHDQHYLDVNENLRSFGGKCLPKDLDFLIDTFSKFNLPQTFFSSVKEDNKLWPVTVRKF